MLPRAHYRRVDFEPGCEVVVDNLGALVNAVEAARLIELTDVNERV
jgi:hypothetical protein